MPALRDDIDPDGLLEYSVVFSDRSLNSMSDAFGEVMRDISRIMKTAYGAASVAVIPGGGTYGMEAIARQFTTDARVMVIRNGWFSFRWSQIIEAGRPSIVLQHAIQGLQGQISDLMDHEKSKKQVNTRAYASYSSRLKGKEGTMRGKGMGKRVNQCARAPITCDDSLKLSEVGVPATVAATLTKNVRVTDYNLEEMEKLVENKQVRYIIMKGKKIDLSVSLTLPRVGDTCQVCLQEGDVVLFNRQPSLHAASIMAHTVKIVPGYTFSVNSAVLPPYAADCDGDEMNLFAPQTIEALAEAETLMSVRMNVISGQSNKPIIGPIQDTILGAYRIGKDTFTREEFAQMGYVGEGSGKQLLERIIPLTHWKCGETRIVGGKLEGLLTKSTLNSHGGLVQVIHNDIGPQRAIDFIHDLQTLAHKYFDLRGFSIGVEDVKVHPQIWKRCKRECQRAFEEVEGKSEEETNQRLNECRETLGKMCIENIEQNAFAECIRSGSKGNMSNLVWILGAIGQQNQEGKRPPNQFTGRTLPHVDKETPIDKGFIRHNYTSGLSPRELWFAAASAREGLVDTAIKTGKFFALNPRTNFITHTSQRKPDTPRENS